MLDGIRVIDLGAFITAPLAAMMLADLGADVIKVEPPKGDPFRGGGGGWPYGATYLAYNRNKRSIALDLTQEKDRATMLRLVARADVLIENFRPGVLEKLGLDPAAMRARHPRLIHCSITGFGTKGPYRERPAFDAVGQAFSGLFSLFVDPQNPQCTGPSLTDSVTGMYACYGVMGALFERQRTGRGRRVEVNMLEASMAFAQDSFTNYTRGGDIGGPFSRVTRSQSFACRCADGLLIALQLSNQDKFWSGLLEALAAPEIGTDARFASHKGRIENYHALAAALGERFIARPRAEWIARLTATDVPFAPVHDMASALADPQVHAMGTAAHMQHPREGEVVAIACPILYDGARPATAMTAPPLIDEQRSDILADWDAGP
jgi:crotonobetainyl-CoA:carnitine CoA-transferase CaiB-like acyl-CoA transferase